MLCTFTPRFLSRNKAYCVENIAFDRAIYTEYGEIRIIAKYGDSAEKFIKIRISPSKYKEVRGLYLALLHNLSSAMYEETTVYNDLFRLFKSI